MPASAKVASSLGAVFDVMVIRRSFLRTFSNQWVDWSDKWTCLFGAEWRRLCRGPLLSSQLAPVITAAVVPDTLTPAPPSPLTVTIGTVLAFKPTFATGDVALLPSLSRLLIDSGWEGATLPVLLGEVPVDRVLALPPLGAVDRAGIG